MTIQAIEIMSGERAAELLARAERLDYIDGVASAGRARDRKHNTQAQHGTEATKALCDEVRTLLFRHPRFRDTAFPRFFPRITVNRYEPGDHYGMHVDAPLMGPPGAQHRSDLSFTLFLSEPDAYEGGELRVADGLAAPGIKLPAGRLALYPTRSPHEVTKVTSGDRVAVIGWIESWIADPTLRELSAKTRALEKMLDAQQIPALAKLMMHEIAHDLVRYSSR